MAKLSAELLVEKSGEAADLLKIIANQHRLLVLCQLLDREQTVSKLLEQLPISQSALSQHLAVLRNAELVATRRQGVEIYYRINDPRVEAILSSIQDAICS